MRNLIVEYNREEAFIFVGRRMHRRTSRSSERRAGDGAGHRRGEWRAEHFGDELYAGKFSRSNPLDPATNGVIPHEVVNVRLVRPLTNQRGVLLYAESLGRLPEVPDATTLLLILHKLEE